ncbi:hypothetical protein BKI52_40195 [marine bacterium AO1-C]|nr:hypothetical protein BKI52_40195 [marine bacterium AO1-C]
MKSSPKTVSKPSLDSFFTYPVNDYPLLHIDENHKFWIVTKVRQEVKMSPLCKALYLLFLQHPDGISLYELKMHQADLLNIYKKISRKNDYQMMRTSIIHLVNRCENSIHEKFTRIKQAFNKVLAPSVASMYYIKGERGKEKKILLSRQLIHQEQQYH